MPHTVARKHAMKDGYPPEGLPATPPGELPARPEDIDLDRIVNDPDYRRAVQGLLRRWGICNKGKTPRR